jgi:hypothetical protein
LRLLSGWERKSSPLSSRRSNAFRMAARTVPWRCKVSKIATPSLPQTTASPFRVNDCALILSRIAFRPVIAAAGEQAHGLAVAADDQSVAIMLDLVHPIRPGLAARDGMQGSTKPSARVGRAMPQR